MSNYVTNILRIVVPTMSFDDLSAALSGPSAWAFPSAVDDYPKMPAHEISAHQAMRLAQLERDLAGEGDAYPHLIPEFHDRYRSLGWPDWMKPSEIDTKMFAAGRRPGFAQIVPFSVARLLPISGPEDIASHIADLTPDGPFFTPDREHYRVKDFICSRIGISWPPGDFEMFRSPIGDGNILLKIEYLTASKPMTGLEAILWKTLKVHDAKALLIWDDDQGFTGMEYLNPLEDRSVKTDFDRDQFVSFYNDQDERVFPNTPEEEDIYRRGFDFHTFIDTIATLIADPDYPLDPTRSF